MAMIEVEGIAKSFGDVHAVREIDLSVEEGTVYGLLGPNGAGKTTVIRILTTLLRPDAGRATVAGFDVVKDARQLRSSIALAGQYAAVDEILTGRENLEMVGRLYRLSSREASTRAEVILDQFDLTEAADRTVRTYSGGMRRRLDLGASLIGNPSVLFLDEPTTGLDPRARRDLWEFIEQLVDGGTTLLLTTQYLEEADRLADRIGVIDQGRLIAEGTSDELKSRIGGDVLELQLSDASRLAAATDALGGVGCADSTIDEERATIRLPVDSGVGAVTEAVRRMDSAGIDLNDITIVRPTLDDVFITLTGEPVEATTTSPGNGGGRRRRRSRSHR